MATNYPSGTDNLTNPAGTSVVTSPDHAAQHTNINDAMEAVQTTAGTTAGTNVLKHFAAGEFPIRATGVAAIGTLVQTVVGGTFTSPIINNSTIGTPAVTGGTANNITLGTPVFSQGAIGGVDLSTSAITLGYAESTSDFTTTSTATYVDVTGLSVAVTVPSGGRKVKITAFCGGLKASGSAGNPLTMAIRESTTVLNSTTVNDPVSAYNVIGIAIAVITPTAGAHTYKVSVAQGLAGTLTVQGGTSSTTALPGAAFILVEAT